MRSRYTALRMSLLLVGLLSSAAYAETGIVRSVNYDRRLVVIDGSSVAVSRELVVHGSAGNDIYGIMPGVGIRYEMNDQEEITEIWVRQPSGKQRPVHVDDDVLPQEIPEDSGR